MQNELPIKFPPITKEWAKQLAFQFLGKFDFATMQVHFVNRHVWRIPFMTQSGVFIRETHKYATVDYEEIELDQVYDPVNHEIHAIGYGPKTNTLLVFKPAPAVSVLEGREEA